MWYTLQKVGQDIETKCLGIATIRKAAVDVRRNRVLQSIQQKIVRNFFQVTEHALDEMRKDLLSLVDVKQALRRGKIVQRFTRDLRGTRYRITGPARDGREINVICRILASGELRIITVYATEEKQ